jgi:hypothetical protein
MKKPLSSVSGPCLEVFVDYALVGYAMEFGVCVSQQESALIGEGSIIKVVGDAVDDRFATVIEFLDDGWVIVRLHRSHRRLPLAVL